MWVESSTLAIHGAPVWVFGQSLLVPLPDKNTGRDQVAKWIYSLLPISAGRPISDFDRAMQLVIYQAECSILGVGEVSKCPAFAACLGLQEWKAWATIWCATEHGLCLSLVHSKWPSLNTVTSIFLYWESSWIWNAECAKVEKPDSCRCLCKNSI